jgi:DNA repair protein RecN (Recombination protein N)
MLTHLQIRDFAIVEAVELEFGPGFTVLTGETGAGKSILVDALLLAVGGRADSGAVRYGAGRAEVTAAFDLTRNAAALAWLAEQGVEHDGEVILRRSVAADGRSRVYVNGQTMPVQALRAIGELLVDIHGQLEFQSLVRRGYQRDLLDESGGLRESAAQMRATFQRWRDLDADKRAFEQGDRDRDHRIELLTHYVTELEALDPEAGEPRRLADERRRIAALGRLADGVAQLEQLLAGDGGDVVAALGRAQGVLRQLSEIDPALNETGGLIDEAAIALREAVAGLRRYADALEADPARQEWVESRLAALEDAARKHRVDVDALPDLRERLTRELATLRQGASDLSDLERRLAAAGRERDHVARELSQSRRDAARILDLRVTEFMQGLGMPGGVFQARVETLDPGHCTEYGQDEVEFLVSANPGQPPRPLAKVASGGELSRISLALQVATLDAAHLPCLVFDEVDAGVGGAVAEMVGRQLHALAASGQVLCVTHLPQGDQAGRRRDHPDLAAGSRHGGAGGGDRPHARRQPDHGPDARACPRDARGRTHRGPDDPAPEV